MSTLCLHNATVLTGISKFSNGAVLIKDQFVEDIYNEERFYEKPYPHDAVMVNLQGAFIAPGFIDTHIHGIGGYGTDDVSEQSIYTMARNLVKYGVTSFFPTLYPNATDIFIKGISEIRNAIQNQDTQKEAEFSARIAGMHLEGPFISPKQPGVQLSQYMQNPNITLMSKFLDEADNTITNMTVAPELKGMRELALFCLRHGIVLQAGHTDAKYNNIVEGIQAGILHSTHMFNAMRPLHHRNPGTVGAILIHNEMSCEIIADGHHVHSEVVKLLLQYKPIEKIVLVTDALKPTMQKNPPFYANGEEVYIKKGAFYRTSDDVMAGSSLTMIRGVQNLCNYGVPIADAVKMATYNPARIFHLEKVGFLSPGNYADIVIFDADFTILYAIVRGTIAYKNEQIA